MQGKKMYSYKWSIKEAALKLSLNVLAREIWGFASYIRLLSQESGFPENLLMRLPT